ncbi:MAG: hypothetical protein HYY01_14715 [Chloroflexi bacterium]|nr:hypothetical protein [Chloroflexota bacterium]
MEELTEEQLQRQDFVDNSIFALIQSLVPRKQGLEWDIEMVGEVRDCIGSWLVERKNVCDQTSFYPYLAQ